MSDKDKALPPPHPELGRERLPFRRMRTGFPVTWRPTPNVERAFHVDIGYRPDTLHVREIFVVPKGPNGSEMHNMMADWATGVSILLQRHGSLAELRRSMGRAERVETGAPQAEGLPAPTSVYGAILDAVAAMERALRHPHEVQAQLGAALGKGGELPFEALARILQQSPEALRQAQDEEVGE